MSLIRRIFSRPTAQASANEPERAPLKTFRFPSKQSAMEDHIAAAQNDSGPFEYVAIGARSTVTKRMARESLLSSRRNYVVKRDQLPELPPLECIDRHMEFSIIAALPKGYLRAGNPWVLVEEVIINYTASQSPADSYSKVKVTLADERNVITPETRSITCPNNFGFDGEMGLDFYVHVRDLPMLKLVVDLQNSVLAEGVTWGSLVIGIKIAQARIALQVARRDTLAVLRVPDTSLTAPRRNPFHIDLSVDQADVDDLGKMFRAGRIIDFERPVDKQQRINYAASEVGSADNDLPSSPSPAGPSNVVANYLRSMDVIAPRPVRPTPDRSTPRRSAMRATPQVFDDGKSGPTAEGRNQPVPTEAAVDARTSEDGSLDQVYSPLSSDIGDVEIPDAPTPTPTPRSSRRVAIQEPED